MRMSLSLFNVLIVGLLLQQACSKKTISPANEVAAIDCPDAGAFVKQVKATNGIVWYSTEKQQYFISVSTGTIDNQDIGFVCNLPDEYKKTGLRVTFGGRYHEFKGVRRQMKVDKRGENEKRQFSKLFHSNHLGYVQFNQKISV